MNLSNNTILITGGANGIGLALAKAFAEHDNTVLITGRDAGSLAAAKRQIPALVTFQSDVSRPGDIAELHRRVTAEFPKLNILINNAGIMRRINLHTFGDDLEDITHEIDTNLSGSIRMVMQFLPQLKTQPRAAIVNVSSGLAFIPFPIAPIYGATKAALHSFTQALRVQLKGSSITVFELAPPATKTALNDVFAQDTGSMPLMELDVLVAATLAGLHKDRLEIRPGLANVLKLMSRLAPSFMLKQLSKSVDRLLAEPKQLVA